MRRTFFRDCTISPNLRPDRGGAVVHPISDIGRAMRSGQNLGTIPVEYSEDDPLNAPFIEMEDFNLPTHERSWEAVSSDKQAKVDYLMDSLSAITNDENTKQDESDSDN